jgi:hypothetical protein
MYLLKDMSCICEVNGLVIIMQSVAEYASLLGLCFQAGQPSHSENG